MEILSYENGFLFQRVDEIKKYIFCMKNGEVSIQQDLTREFPNGSYKIVDFLDGTRHLTMNGGTHDFGVILEEHEGTIFEAIDIVQRLRAVVAVMEP